MRPRPRGGKDRQTLALRYIGEGRLVVAYLDGAYVSAVCRLDDGVVNLGFDTDQGWWCSCGEESCAHLTALKLVTERAITVFSSAARGAGPGASRAESASETVARAVVAPVERERDELAHANDLLAEGERVEAEPADHPPTVESAATVVEESRTDEGVPDVVSKDPDVAGAPYEDGGEDASTAADVGTVPSDEPSEPSEPSASAPMASWIEGPTPDAGEGAEGGAPVVAPPRPTGPSEPLGPTFVGTGKSRRRGFVPVALVVAALIAIGVAIWTAHPFHSAAARSPGPPTPVVSPSPGRSPTSTPTVSPTPSPARSPGTVTVTAATAIFPRPVRAFGVGLSVRRLSSHDSDCLTHLFGAAAAYQSDCRSWARVPGVVWFWVTVRNGRGSALAFDLRRFVLQGGNGKAARAVELRPTASNPQDFLPSRAKIKAGRAVGGWLTFRDPGRWTPDGLVFGVGTGLEIEFHGARVVNGRA